LRQIQAAAEVVVIQLDYTLLIQMANFLVLLLILNKFLYKPILNLLDERRRRLEDSEKLVSDLKEKTSRQWEQYEAELQRARISALAEREKLKAEGSEAERKLLEEARDQASKLMHEARRRLDEESQKAREVLKAQAQTLGLEMAEKILGRQLK
jgi:F-type H+-transporting ATPase subunit b